MIYILTVIIIVIAYKIFCLYPTKYNKFYFDPSALYCFYGAPGCGKSTLASWFARCAIANGYTVYSNMPIKGCRKFDKSDIGVWCMENCLVLWDEIGVDANSRNFKTNFNINQIKWLKYHRHENAMVMIFSQGFDDMDKIVRTLTTAAFIVKKGLFKTVKYKRIAKNPDIDEITHKPDDLYSFVPFSTKRISARSAWKYFDSFSRLNLPHKNWEIYGESDKQSL